MKEERLATLSALQQERVEALREADVIKTRAVDASVAGLKEVVDYAFWRLAALLLFFLVTAAVLGTVAFRLTVGRHRPAAS